MRVLVGRLFHESHCFNPIPTRAADFVILRGGDALDAARGSTLGGIVGALRAAGSEFVAAPAAMARPGGPVEHAAYEALKREFLDCARTPGIAAVVLELHGAMTTDKLHDVEGDLLQALRTALGPRVAIAAGLDLHAHVTPAMLESADIVIACKHNPHADVVETGEKLAALVLAQLDGAIRPVKALVKLPMLLRGGLETAAAPLADIHARARQWIGRRPALLDVSICNVHSYLDVPGLGQAILVTADGDPAVAAAAAQDIASEMWRQRDRFVHSFPSIDEALDIVAAGPRRCPWVLADWGDRVLAGAPGDSTAILQRLVERHHGLRAAIPVTDPESVAAARSAGVGSGIRLAVGGRITPGFAPIPIEGHVAALGDGRFVMRGPYQAGQPGALGHTAVINADPVTLLLTSQAGLTQDPAAFTSQGINIGDHDLVVAKSGYHFKLSFAGIATPLVVDTPGLTNWRRGFFRYRHARPFYPEDEISIESPAAQVFDTA